MNKKARAAAIYNRLCEALGTDTRVTKGSLARALGCGEKTIQRDIEELGDSFPGVIVEYDDSLKTYYLSQEGITKEQLKKEKITIRMQNYDLFLLLMGTHILAQYQDSPAYTRMRKALERIAAQLPDNPAVISHQALARSLTSLARPLRPVDPDIFDLVKQGIERLAELEIVYRSPEGKKTKRKIHPLYLDSMDGDLYTIAWCLLRKEVRIFALSRIQTAKKTGEDFTPAAHPEIRQYLENRFGIFMDGMKNEYKIRLRFTRDQAPYVRERQWHKNQKLTELKSGEIELAFTATHLFEVTRWVLSWGPSVKVLGPKELQAAVKTQLAGALKQYR